MVFFPSSPLTPQGEKWKSLLEFHPNTSAPKVIRGIHCLTTGWLLLIIPARAIVLWCLVNTLKRWMAQSLGWWDAGWEEYWVALGAILCSPCSLLGSVVKSQCGHLFSSLLKQQLLWQSTHTACGEEVARTCWSLHCPVFYYLSHSLRMFFLFLNFFFMFHFRDPWGWGSSFCLASLI